MDDLHAAVGGEGLMDALLDVHGLFEGAEMADEDFPDGGLIPAEDVQLGEGAFDLRFDRLGLLHGLALVVAGVDLHAVGVALGLFRGGQLDVVDGALNGGVGVARDSCDGGNEVEVGFAVGLTVRLAVGFVGFIRNGDNGADEFADGRGLMDGDGAVFR
mgnify:CR=1 FL=1